MALTGRGIIYTVLPFSWSRGTQSQLSQSSESFPRQRVCGAADIEPEWLVNCSWKLDGTVKAALRRR